MVISGEYEDRVILRKLSIDYGEDVTGFDGRKMVNRMLFHEYDGIVTPTLVLADHSGQPLTKPLVGINTVEFFGWYLDQAIDSALTRLRTPAS
jgi:thioredoxin-related protein